MTTLRLARLSAMLCLLVGLAGCQRDEPVETTSDFAILAQAAEGFEQAGPGRALQFPRDHGPHPRYRIEWWYLTANLEGADGRRYGAQWTLFRSAMQPPGSPGPDNPWNSEQVYMAHFAVTGPAGHRAFQRYSRGGTHDGLARAGARHQPFAAWMDDWRLASTGPDWLPLKVHAGQDGFAMDLTLRSDRPLLLQGEAGFSQKHPDGGGSFYYSHPFLQASGRLTLAGESVRVTGQAWLDREWSSQFLQPDQQGWDWFALHLDSGEKLMLFQLRPLDTGSPSETAYRHGVLISANGRKTTLDPERFRLEPKRTASIAGRDVPVEWSVRLEETGREMTVSALIDDQWMDVDFPYWEGVVEVDGNGAANRGIGFLEMTGYPRASDG